MNCGTKTSTTVNRALETIQQAVNITEKAKQLRLLNEIRQWIYAQQSNLGLDLSKTLCMQVQKFCNDCSTCKNPYWGFRLPGDTVSTEAVSINLDHVDSYSHWRLPYDGIAGTPCSTELRLIDQGYKATERDIDCGCLVGIVLQALNPKCDEQLVIVTGVTMEDVEQTFQVKLGREPAKLETQFRTITGVRFPNGADGVVVLRQAGGKELARYPNGENMGRFREYRLYGGDCRCIKNIVVIANCAYSDVCDDCDVVEFGNTLVWKWLAQYLTLMNKGDKNGNDRANMATFLQSASDLMIQSAAVEEGEGTQFIFQRKPLNSQPYLRHDRNCRRWFQADA